MPSTSYRIILKSHIFYEKYLQGFADANREGLQLLHEKFHKLNPAQYRGIGRPYLDAAPFYMDETGQLQPLPETNIQKFDELNARRRIAQLEATARCKETTDDFCFTDREELEEVWALLENPERYEKVHLLKNAPGIDETTLGFDVGQWSGNYSILCDAVITPVWHPIDFDDMQGLEEKLQELNPYCLFPTLQQAQAFLDVYVTKQWSEKGRFEVVQVREVK